MEVGQAEFFVRAVRVVVVLAPTQQQRIDSQLSRKVDTIGIEPPSRMNTGCAPKAGSIAAAAASCRDFRAAPRRPARRDDRSIPS